jgi:hypothetical protein
VKVDNQVANDLLIAVRKGQQTQEFIDAISGVVNYKLNDHNRQGHIRSTFAKELISEQFLLQFDDIISVFWKGVFEKLDSAKLYGEVVKVKQPGKSPEKRPTNNNPIHFLRYHGRMAVRNHITSLYRKNLEQNCTSCGFRTAVKNDKRCKKCGSEMVTTYKFIGGEEDTIQDESYKHSIEQRDISEKFSNMLNEFSEKVLGKNTRAYQIMEILIEPQASKAMCAACKLCDAETFDIDSCINYNANIGKWLGVNKTMIANKVRSIRKRLPEWLKTQPSDEAAYFLETIPKKHKIFLNN